MRLLSLAHNHPALQPGGTETVARGLFRAMVDRMPGVEGMFLAATTGAQRAPKPGTLLQAAPGGRADEALVFLPHFDRFFLQQIDAEGLAMTLGPLLEWLRPDIIHLHHPLQFGLESIALLRRLAPRRARLVITLHDYFALCPREGQLLRADGRLCAGPAPDACRHCLPERPGADFTLREIAIRDAFAQADALIAPSRFLRDRFIAAGWDPGAHHPAAECGWQRRPARAASRAGRPTRGATASPSSAISTASRAAWWRSRPLRGFPPPGLSMASLCMAARRISRRRF